MRPRGRHGPRQDRRLRHPGRTARDVQARRSGGTVFRAGELMGFARVGPTELFQKHRDQVDEFQVKDLDRHFELWSLNFRVELAPAPQPARHSHQIPSQRRRCPMSIRFPLLAAGLLCACAAMTSAADWPEFRGPNRDGVCSETGLLREWPKNGPAKAWTAKNLGLGFGTPSVAAGKIFGMGTRNSKDGVWAIKESDGTEIWFTPFDDPRKTDQNNGPSGTPTYRDGKLYALSSNGKLVCLDATDGKKVWGTDYLADFGGSVPSWGYTESPLVDGDKVICAPGSAKATVVSRNKDTGKVIWKTETKSGAGRDGGHSSPIKASIGDVPMYVILLGQTGGLIAVHAETGKLLWQYTAAALGGTAQIPIPIIKGDLVWLSTGYNGGSALLRLSSEGEDKLTVKELKTYKKELMNHHGGMVLVGDCIYFGHN